MSQDAAGESVTGWLRLGCGAVTAALLPLWIVLVALSLHRAPDGYELSGVFAALASGTGALAIITFGAVIVLGLTWAGSYALARRPRALTPSGVESDLPADSWRDPAPEERDGDVEERDSEAQTR